MITAFRSELLKLRAHTYTIGVAGMAAFMSVTMLITVGGASEQASDRGPAGIVLARAELETVDGLGRALGNGVTFLGIVALTIAAINVGGEYGNGTIRNLLIRQPKRGRLLLGKSLGLLTYTLTAVVVAGLVGIAAAFGFAGANSIDTAAWTTPQGAGATTAGLVNLAIGVVGWGSLGIALGFAVRSAPAAIGLGVAYALPLEVMLAELIGPDSSILPGQVFQALARGGTPWLSHPDAMARTVLWILIAAAVSVAVFHRRDPAD